MMPASGLVSGRCRGGTEATREARPWAEKRGVMQAGQPWKTLPRDVSDEKMMHHRFFYKGHAPTRPCLTRRAAHPTPRRVQAHPG